MFTLSNFYKLITNLNTPLLLLLLLNETTCKNFIKISKNKDFDKNKCRGREQQQHYSDVDSFYRYGCKFKCSLYDFFLACFIVSDPFLCTFYSLFKFSNFNSHSFSELRFKNKVIRKLFHFIFYILVESLKSEESILRAHLLANYSSDVRPVVNVSAVTLVNITLTILQIMDLVECRNLIFITHFTSLFDFPKI
jgi:hypothetical protein